MDAAPALLPTSFLGEGPRGQNQSSSGSSRREYFRFTPKVGQAGYLATTFTRGRGRAGEREVNSVKSVSKREREEEKRKEKKSILRRQRRARRLEKE